MRIAKMFTTIGLALLISGCVTSLRPLYTSKDLTFDPGLVGVWKEADEEGIWIFAPLRDKAYDLVYIEDGKQSEYKAHLVRLGQFLFLDIYPREPDIEDGFYKLHLIPTHTIARVWEEGDTLRLAFLDGNWIDKAIAAQEINLAHERVDGRLILTAPTEELQNLVLTYAEDPRAFPDPGEMHRVR